jgi:transposase
MDNDLSQTSKKSMQALSDIEAQLHNIPPRSPGLNPIENVFHLLKKRLRQQALDMRIDKESFENFKERVLRCCNDISIARIDKTIASLPKRIDAVIEKNGSRTKY